MTNNNNENIYNSNTIEKQLKCKIDNALSVHSYSTSIFFSDKLLNLVTIHSKKYVETLYTLCNSLYLDKQFQRSSFLITKYLNDIYDIEKKGEHLVVMVDDDNDDISNNNNLYTFYKRIKKERNDDQYRNIILKLRYLAAKCKIETNEFDQCLQILFNDDDDNNNNNSNNQDNQDGNENNDNDDDEEEDNDDLNQLLKFYTNRKLKENKLNSNNNNSNNNNSNKEILIIKSNIASIKGKCFEAMDNLKKAKYWYIKALLLDYNCFEAFDALTKNHLLTYQEEIQLLEKLNFSNDDLWIKEIYLLSLKKYDSPKFTFNYNYLQIYDTLNNQNNYNNNNNNNNNNNISTDDLITLPKNTITTTADGGGGESTTTIITINEIRNKLIECNDILTSIAEYYFYKHQFQESYSITNRILKQDKYYNNSICLMIHISSMFELQLTDELYFTCHELVDSNCEGNSNGNGSGGGGNGSSMMMNGSGGIGNGTNTSIAISWYGVACYYQLIQNSDQAQRFFTKSTTIDNKIGSTWLAFGHFFAGKGEHDQAMAAYRTASRLLTGCHLPLLCIGMELIRVHNLNLASQYILQAKDICPYDPMIFNELGIIEYKNAQYEDSIKLFETSLEICKIKTTSSTSTTSTSTTSTTSSIPYSESSEPTIYNLAHCYRKLRKFEAALYYYTMSLSLLPDNASTLTALGFTHHLQGNFDDAIEYYHQSLSIRDDTFTNVLLHKALSLSILEYD